jgi:hypothetical protein
MKTERSSYSKLGIAAAVAAAFVLLAIGGSVFTSRQMNNAADIHAGSAGRPGDPMPNATQEQQDKASARGVQTNGMTSNSSVPPAR